MTDGLAVWFTSYDAEPFIFLKKKIAVAAMITTRTIIIDIRITEIDSSLGSWT